MDQLYSLSQGLYSEVLDTVERIKAGAGYHVEFSEFITLPDYGQRVILRFNLINDTPFVQQVLDKLATQMRALAGDAYWVTVTDRLQTSAEKDMPARLTAIDQTLPDCLLNFSETPHSEAVRNDAEIVRQAIHLDAVYRVFEIEAPVSDSDALPQIRIVDTGDPGDDLSSRRQPMTLELGGRLCDVVFLKQNPSFRGCVKAYVAAQSLQTTLSNYVAQFNRTTPDEEILNKSEE